MACVALNSLVRANNKGICHVYEGTQGDRDYQRETRGLISMASWKIVQAKDLVVSVHIILWPFS